MKSIDNSCVNPHPTLTPMKTIDLSSVSRHPTLKLMDEIEALFVSGADDLNSEEELLALLEWLDWDALRNYILSEAKTLYEYTMKGPLCYFGAKLRGLSECGKAALLYCSSQPAQTRMGVTCQRFLELWISEDMNLFVTSCFRSTTCSETPTISEYRAFHEDDWLNTELVIDFRALAQDLKAFCAACGKTNAPFFEVSGNG